MNVKEYIQSGVVESYVLGLATDAEQKEFEQMCAEYPEIAQAKHAFERLLEEQLMQDAVEPPAVVRTKVFEAIRPDVTGNGTPEEIQEAPVRRMNVWKWVAAASLILLAGTGYWAYITNEKYKEVVAKQATTENELQQKNSELTAMQEDARMMQNPNVKMAALKGTANAPQALTTVFWDSASKDVYLFVNNLPQAPSEKQYQLWALVDGQPIDLGMLEVKEKRLLVKMKNVQNAQAFAITLERRGRPNQDKPEGEMYVVGNL